MTAFNGPSRTTLSAILSAYRGTAFTPGTVYLAALTAQPTDNNGTGLVEVVNGASANQWSGYARQSLAASTSGWDAPAGTTQYTIQNHAALTFPTASISSGSVIVTGWALYDALTVGNILWSGQWYSASDASHTTPLSFTLVDGSVFSVAADALTLQES